MLFCPLYKCAKYFGSLRLFGNKTGWTLTLKLAFCTITI